MGCGGSTPAENEPVLAEKALSAEEVEKSGKTADELRQRLLVGSEQAEKHTLGSTGFILRYAALSQRGYTPEEPYKANFDRFAVLPSIAGKANQILFGIFDGHGPEGDAAADFMKKNLGPELTKMMGREKYKFDFRRAFQQTFFSLDEQMHVASNFDDSASGCTAISAVFRGGDLVVANIGNSRAVLGERRGKRVMAYSLSVDQTPYRKDERERVKSCGAQVLTMAMAQGQEKIRPDWDSNIESLDGTTDAPLLFAKGSLQPAYPFTRSLGDSMSIRLGLNAEAELLQKALREQDQFILLASDGVWEYMTNQIVCNMVIGFKDPVEACKAVIASAYGYWLQFEVRTDDITVILAYIDTAEGQAPRPPSDAEIAEFEESRATVGTRRVSRNTATGIESGLETVEAGESRPVGRGPSSAKKKQLGMKATQEEDIDEKEQGGWKMVKVDKTPSEIARIQAALKGNFLFLSFFYHFNIFKFVLVLQFFYHFALYFNSFFHHYIFRNLLYHALDVII